MTRLKVMDLFCGTGGFSKGFENTGAFEVVYGIDILPLSVETFRLNHMKALSIAADISSVRRKEVSERLGLGQGDIDVIIGGPPCQGFSSIRPFRSSLEDDPRNSLFEEFASYVNYFRPAMFVLENVVGLATHHEGRTLEKMQEAFDGLGYGTDWRILNTAYFGVPQKRERLILLGAQPGIPLPWPIPTHDGDFRTIGHWQAGRVLRPEAPDLFSAGNAALFPAVTVEDAIDDLPPIASGEEAMRYTMDARTAYQLDRREGATALTLHASTRHTDKMLEIIRHSGPNISSIPPHLITSGFSSCYSRLEADEPSPTITVNFIHPASNKCIHPSQDRALTVREGARIQSFDDTFLFAGTNRSKIAKQIGNAVPPLLGRTIANELATALTGANLQTA
jgi:DNA (cytosine-5)-methyltransferase 1